jgi:5,10-methylenetetrahydrofolate reductase
VHNGFPSLVVLGGDKHVGRPRALEHAWQLRRLIRERHPELELGGWANPTADPVKQIEFLTRPDFHADFFLTQIVSHHQAEQVAAFLDAGRARGLAMPGVFGVFYYRSANPKTLEMLCQDDSMPDRRRREALLREQPSRQEDRSHLECHSRPGRRDAGEMSVFPFSFSL